MSCELRDVSHLTGLTDCRLLSDDVRPLWGRRSACGGGVEPHVFDQRLPMCHPSRVLTVNA